MLNAQLEVLRRFTEVAAKLKETTASTFGPEGGDLLLVTAANQVTIVGSGSDVVRALQNPKLDPVSTFLLKVINSFEKRNGDGSTAFCILLSSLLTSVQHGILRGCGLRTYGLESISRKELMNISRACRYIRQCEMDSILADLPHSGSNRKVFFRALRSSIRGQFGNDKEIELCRILFEWTLMNKNDLSNSKIATRIAVLLKNFDALVVMSLENKCSYLLNKNSVVLMRPSLGRSRGLSVTEYGEKSNVNFIVLDFEIEYSSRVNERVLISSEADALRAFDYTNVRLLEFIQRVALEKRVNVIVSTRKLPDPWLEYSARHGVLSVQNVPGSVVERLCYAASIQPMHTFPKTFENLEKYVGHAEWTKERSDGLNYFIEIGGISGNRPSKFIEQLVICATNKDLGGLYKKCLKRLLRLCDTALQVKNCYSRSDD